MLTGNKWHKWILIELNVMKQCFEFEDIPINIFIQKCLCFIYITIMYIYILFKVLK